ncbi:MAG: hypothetical protein HY248_02340, partial [Fimbriimonas ginsengisoli]|nr:hypothetical protein [Fimbriimonas ginsengisoli]
AEVDAQLRSVGRMFGRDWQPKPEERPGLFQSVGLGRDHTRLELQPAGKWKLAFDSLRLDGRTDAGRVDGFEASSTAGSLRYRHERFGSSLTELNSLMGFEKEKLGVLAGLDRTDLGFTFALSPRRNFVFDSMRSDLAAGGASRLAWTLNDPRGQLSFSQHRVDAGFDQAAQLVDPEKDLLAALRGYAERDAHAKWQLTPALKFDGLFGNASSTEGDRTRQIQNLLLGWAASKTTSVEFAHLAQRDADPTGLLSSAETDRLTLLRDFGRLGKLKFQTERNAFDGSIGHPAGFVRELLNYDVKLPGRTSLTTEQIRTRWQDGQREDSVTETLAVPLGKRAGMSLTEGLTDRQGDGKDEHRRSLGFWFELAKDMKLNYGKARQIALHKCLTTPRDPSVAALEGLAELTR